MDMKTTQEIIEQLIESFDSNTDYMGNIIIQSKFKTFEKNLFKFLKKYKENPNYDPWEYNDQRVWEYNDQGEESLANLIENYCEKKNSNHQEIENLIANKPYLIYHYCVNVKESRWPEVENVVLQNLHVAIDYALEVIGDRWEPLDNLIIEKKLEPSFILKYFNFWKNKERWKEAESIIFSSSSCILEYCEILEQRIPEVEPILLKQIDAAHHYVNQFKFRWPEYEKKIAKKPKRILDYARNVIGGRLPDELHNRMLMNKMSGGDNSEMSVLTYFDYLSECEKSTINFLRSIDDEQRSELLRKI